MGVDPTPPVNVKITVKYFVNGILDESVFWLKSEKCTVFGDVVYLNLENGLSGNKAEGVVYFYK